MADDAHDRWYTLGAFRGCDAHDHEHGINYSAVMEAAGPGAVLAAIRAGDATGMLTPVGHDRVTCTCYAVLDMLGDDGDVLADRCIPTPEAFAWWVQAVELRATSSDCHVDEPEAYARTYSLA